MNERIRQLARQSTGARSTIYMLEEEWTKFAELIVRECMGLCYRIDTEYEGKKVKPTVIASKVAEYFGVEE